MRKLLFLAVVSLFCLNCGGAATSTTSTTTSANKPANTTAPTNSAPPPSNAAAPAKPEGASNPDLDFTLVNKTGYEIKQLSIGATGTGDWAKEDEVLKGKSFADGASLDIKFHPRATAEKWDIKVEWADGSPGVEWENLNLTKIEKVTLTYDKASNKTTANIE